MLVGACIASFFCWISVVICQPFSSIGGRFDAILSPVGASRHPDIQLSSLAQIQSNPIGPFFAVLPSPIRGCAVR